MSGGLRARLEALEARRRAGSMHEITRDALACMHAPHLARDPVLAGRLRSFRIAYAIETHLTASAVVANLREAGIVFDPADAATLLVAARTRAAVASAGLRQP